MFDLVSSPFVEAAFKLAVGMLFIYILLGLIVTQLSSLILNVLNLRARQLKEGLQELITDRDVLAKLLAHPMIRLVNERVNPGSTLTADQAAAIVELPPTHVSFIPSDVFTKALFSIFAALSDGQIFQQLRNAIAQLPEADKRLRLNQRLRELRMHGPEVIPILRDEILTLHTDDAYKQTLLNALGQIEDTFEHFNLSSVELLPVYDGVQMIKDTQFRITVETLLSTSYSLADAHSQFEMLYDHFLDRISDLWKRKMQYVALMISVVLVIILNVDTLAILLTSLGTANTQFARQAVGVSSSQPATETSPNLDDKAQTIEDLLRLQLPIGWDYIPVTPELVTTAHEMGLGNPYYNQRNLWNFVPNNNPDWLSRILPKIIGLGLSAIIISQFSPFLFDLMRRFTSRS